MIRITTLPHVFWCAHSFVQKKGDVGLFAAERCPEELAELPRRGEKGSHSACRHVCEVGVKMNPNWHYGIIYGIMKP